MYIVWYTILYYILYIYISLSMKNSHSEVCSFQSWLNQVPRHSPHEFWRNDFGRPIFRRACRSNPTSYRPPPPSEAEKHWEAQPANFASRKKSLNECRNGMNDSLITWFTHWICIYIYIRLRYVFPPSKHMPQMSHVRASFQRPSSNRRRASFTRCPPSRFDRRFTPRAQIIMAFAGQTRLDLLGDHLEIGNMIDIYIYIYLFIYLFI